MEEYIFNFDWFHNHAKNTYAFHGKLFYFCDLDSDWKITD